VEKVDKWTKVKVEIWGTWYRILKMLPFTTEDHPEAPYGAGIFTIIYLTHYENSSIIYPIAIDTP
jgi:hypothetical protein